MISVYYYKTSNSMPISKSSDNRLVVAAGKEQCRLPFSKKITSTCVDVTSVNGAAQVDAVTGQVHTHRHSAEVVSLSRRLAIAIVVKSTL